MISNPDLYHRQLVVNRQNVDPKRSVNGVCAVCDAKLKGVHSDLVVRSVNIADFGPDEFAHCERIAMLARLIRRLEMTLDRQTDNVEHQVEVIRVQVGGLQQSRGQGPSSVFGQRESLVEDHRIELVARLNVDEKLAVNERIVPVGHRKDEIIALVVDARQRF